MKRFLPLLLLFICVSSTAQDFRRIADSIRFKRRIPALAYMVVTPDSILLMETSGYRKFRTKDTVTINNRFHLGSASNAITSMIAAQLIAKGKLKWNSTVAQVFPEYATKLRKEFRNVNLAELLSQQAGFKVITTVDDFNEVPDFVGDASKQRAQFVQWVGSRPGIDNTGGVKRMSFTTANTAVAAAMMEKASGKKWEQLLDEFVNKPLDIQMKTGWPNKADGKDTYGHWEAATGYTAIDTQSYKIKTALSPAADVNVSVRDFAVFLQDNLKGLAGKTAKMPNRSYEVLHNSYKGYSMGWQNVMLSNFEMSIMDGSAGTYYCYTTIIREKNIAIAVFSNSGDAGGKAACVNLARILQDAFIQY